MYAKISKGMSSQRVSFHAKRNRSFSFLLDLMGDVLIVEEKVKKNSTWLFLIGNVIDSTLC